MDAVITRIIEIERESALGIGQAEDTSRKNIEAHRRALEEEKERTHPLIITAENTRLAQALQALNKQTREESINAGKDYESLFHDAAKVTAIKEKIVNILLAQ